MSSDASKGVKEIIRQVRRMPGWSVEIGSHIKFRLNGRVMAIAPSTPGDRRTVQNLRADLKRKGCPL